MGVICRERALPFGSLDHFYGKGGGPLMAKVAPKGPL